MNSKIYLYILVCAGVSLLIRELPLTLIRKPIKNRLLRDRADSGVFPCINIKTSSAAAEDVFFIESDYFANTFFRFANRGRPLTFSSFVSP